MITVENFKDKFVDYFRMNDVTAYQAAKDSGILSSTILPIVRGDVYPNMKTFLLIMARGLKKDPADFFNDTWDGGKADDVEELRACYQQINIPEMRDGLLDYARYLAAKSVEVEKERREQGKEPSEEKSLRDIRRASADLRRQYAELEERYAKMAEQMKTLDQATAELEERKRK